MSEMLRMAPLSPVREWLIARSFMSEHLAADGARDEFARHERGRHREYFARGGRRAAAAGPVRVQRLDLRTNSSGIRDRRRPRRDSKPDLVGAAVPRDPRAMECIDTNQVGS